MRVLDMLAPEGVRHFVVCYLSLGGGAPRLVIVARVGFRYGAEVLCMDDDMFFVQSTHWEVFLRWVQEGKC